MDAKGNENLAMLRTALAGTLLFGAILCFPNKAECKPVYVLAEALVPADRLKGPEAEKEIGQAVVNHFRKSLPNKKVISFLGYSAAGYEEPQIVDRYISKVLAHECPNPKTCEVLLGSTDGIFRAARVSQSRGIDVTVITSEDGIKQLENRSAQDQDLVNTVYRIDSQFVGWVIDEEGNKEISAIAHALILSSDMIHMIGGGHIGIAETEYSILMGKDFTFFPAKFNIETMSKLIEKRKNTTKPANEPPSIYGFVYSYLMQIDPNKVRNVKVAYPPGWQKDPNYLGLVKHLKINSAQGRTE